MKFITGNIGKFNEMKEFFPGLQQLDIDLPEIQELDPHLVIAAKIKEAQGIVPAGTEFIIEDTSLCVSALNDLPGTFVKWFLDSLGTNGIWNLVKDNPNKKAYAKTIIGYNDSNNNIHFFEGIIDGHIIAPTNTGFGWNPLFQADGSSKNFSEMNLIEKKQFSMRAQAAQKLQQFLDIKN